MELAREGKNEEVVGLLVEQWGLEKVKNPHTSIYILILIVCLSKSLLGPQLITMLRKFRPYAIAGLIWRSEIRYFLILMY